MIGSILVPVDGSPFAEHSLKLAVNIARKANATLDVVLVHVPHVSAEIFSDGTQVAVETISDDVEVPVELIAEEPDINQELYLHECDYLKNLQRRLTRSSEIKIKMHHRNGNVVNQLEEEVIGLKIDLVVMTTHGCGALSRFWLGSVTDELVRRLHVPILLIRPENPSASNSKHDAIKRILIPLDGSSMSESVLESALDLGDITESEITLLRVVSTPPNFDSTSENQQAKFMPHVKRAVGNAESYLEKLALRLERAGRRIQTRVTMDWHVASAILNEANEMEADLIALATHGRSGLPRVFFGSVADKVLRGAVAPVLLVSGNRRAVSKAPTKEFHY